RSECLLFGPLSQLWWLMQFRLLLSLGQSVPSGDVAYPIWIASGPFPAYHMWYPVPSWISVGFPRVWSQPLVLARRTGFEGERVQLRPSGLVAYPTSHRAPIHPCYHLLSAPPS